MIKSTSEADSYCYLDHIDSVQVRAPPVHIDAYGVHVRVPHVHIYDVMTIWEGSVLLTGP